MTFEHRVGDLFEQEDAEAIGHGVNCKGKMGSGIAVTFRDTFEEMHEKYVDLCPQWIVHPQAHLARATWRLTTLLDSNVHIFLSATRQSYKRGAPLEHYPAYIFHVELRCPTCAVQLEGDSYSGRGLIATCERCRVYSPAFTERTVVYLTGEQTWDSLPRGDEQSSIDPRNGSPGVPVLQAWLRQFAPGDSLLANLLAFQLEEDLVRAHSELVAQVEEFNSGS